MKVWLTLAWQSAWSRRFVLSLAVLAVALSTFVLLSIERLRSDVQSSFSQAVSGTDLIVGPRTGPVQLLMYTVFRLGQPGNTISERSLQAVAAHRAVAWVVPMALGDSHRGYPVVATTSAYFDHFQYGEQQALVLAQGQRFADDHDVVLGAEVVARLGYKLGDQVVLAHGDGALEENDHDEHPLVVSGILAPTGTPVDRSLHVSLEAMDEVHGGGPMGFLDKLMPGELGGIPDVLLKMSGGRKVNAALVGLKARAAVFSVQRHVNEMPGEPLMAILPGVVLDELWQVVGPAERALWLVSVLVAVVSLLGLMATSLAGLDARRRELAILRTVGAGPGRIALLLALEGALVALVGMALGLVTALAATWLAADAVRQHTGVNLDVSGLSAGQWPLLAAILVCACLVSLVPGWRAYRLALQDGLSPRS